MVPAFSAALRHRSKAASSFGFGSDGVGALGALLAQMYLSASLELYLGEFIGRAAGAVVDGREGLAGV